MGRLNLFYFWPVTGNNVAFEILLFFFLFLNYSSLKLQLFLESTTEARFGLSSLNSRGGGPLIGNCQKSSASYACASSVKLLILLCGCKEDTLHSGCSFFELLCKKSVASYNWNNSGSKAKEQIVLPKS